MSIPLPTLESTKVGTLQNLDAEFQRRLAAVSHDGRVFDLSGLNKDFVADYHIGATETDALFGAGTWGPEVWPYMSDEGAPYDLADAAVCRQWALSMFILYADVFKVRNAHAAAINAAATIEAARTYDFSTGWPA